MHLDYHWPCISVRVDMSTKSCIGWKHETHANAGVYVYETPRRRHIKGATKAKSECECFPRYNHNPNPNFTRMHKRSPSLSLQAYHSGENSCVYGKINEWINNVNNVNTRPDELMIYAPISQLVVGFEHQLSQTNGLNMETCRSLSWHCITRIGCGTVELIGKPLHWLCWFESHELCTQLTQQMVRTLAESNEWLKSWYSLFLPQTSSRQAR